ncbi:DNA-binding transcriptional MerR regulator [Cellulosimicrobium cellulans]|uniref:MerR family transcriptional regulator n=1 Tax=Cellulosimicrobium cellulans TaxID=1710 RepID=UPI001FCAF93C|nr:MerR family transcriptional regulator [Cellulosimicrobium cellulans]MBM7821584.1 DNA-binding transcriptional MerR regulator [Cellulosimicrobium cellulans]
MTEEPGRGPSGGVGSPPLRTSDVARATGWSVQQVRDLEALGVLPPAGRSANGYRTFGEEHVLALRAYRGLAAAVGPVEARRVLRSVRTLTFDEATALVGALHVTLARERAEALAARRALLAIRAEDDDAGRPPGAATARRDDDADGSVLTITQLAAALGVRASTLRFWEREGLLAPDRVASRAGSVSARRYPPAAVREARVVAALRSAGYRVPDVRRTIDALRRTTGPSDVADPLAALDARFGTIARRTVALLDAGHDVARLLAHAVQ